MDGQDFLYTFSTNFDWGETGVGDWTLNVVDAATGNTGMVNNWTLNLYGDTITKNDTYIYTNDFAKEGINDLASRQTLSDTNKGKDTINAAAVSSDLVLNLRPGKTSTIAGREVTIASGTTIEKAFGGDGNDVIWGNKKNNILNGGRGNDQLWGRKGFNTLTGGDGNDTFVFNRVKKYTFDTITDFEMGKDLMDVSQIVGDINNSEFEFEDYFQFVSQGSGTEVQINELGDDDGNFVTIATLDNVNATELSSEQFIV